VQAKKPCEYVDEIDQVSIPSTFNVQLLRTQIPNAQKRQSSQQCRLALLGPTGVKAVRIMLMKLTPGVNYINILCAIFLPISFCQKIQSQNELEKSCATLSYKKHTHQMLMKLTSTVRKKYCKCFLNF